MKWTDEQQQVIDARNSNLLVAAAAGSGKTAVLVERLLGRIIPDCDDYKKEDYTDIDRVLVVTFTRDAASELRERIDKALDKRLNDCTSKTIADIILRQKSLLSMAHITTIDSFCMDVVKQNFVQCGIDPSFAIGDKTELELLEDDIITDLLEEYYAEKNPVFLRVANTYMSKDSDIPFKETLLKIFKFAQNDVNPVVWLDIQKERYTDPENFDFWDSVWGKSLGMYFYGVVCDVYEVYCELQQLCAEYGVFCYQKKIDEETLALESLKKNLEAGNIRDALDTSCKSVFDGKIGTARGDNKTVYSELVKNRRTKISKHFKTTYDSFFAGFAPDTQMKILSPDVLCICKIIKEFHNRLLDEKNKIRKYSFQDIAHFALSLLVDDHRKEGKGFVPTEIAHRYQRQFDEIYIDEYQDTSIIQEILLTSVSGRDCGAENLFMVGDIKQSIYGFRHACPELFLEKYNSYTENDIHNRLICLYKNFRSRKNIVDGTNVVFSKIMKKATADMDYTEKEFLNYGASYYDVDEKSAQKSDQKCEIVSISDIDSDECDDVVKDTDKSTLQARFIAGKIIEMVSSGYEVFDTSTNSMRPVKYSDFVILIRDAGAKAPAYVEVLASYGIPVFAPASKSFYSAPEIATIISYLKILDNPHQDIPLMSVMRSPLFNFSDEDIAEVKAAYKYTDLYTSCEYFSKSDYDDEKKNRIKEKILNLTAHISELRTISGMVGVYDVLWMIVNEKDFYNRIGLYKNGENCQANIRMLLDMADKFDNNGGQGLFKFIRYIQRLENENKEIEEASVCSESANVVRIKTIHTSKGLEFPVVFLAETEKLVYSDMDNYAGKRAKISTVLLHRKLGINPMCYEKGKYVSVTYSSLMRDITKQVQKKEQIAEEMRLLYVAITRAREKFFAVGIGTEDDLSKCTDENCSSFDILLKPSYQKWLFMSTADADSWSTSFIEKHNAYNYPDEIIKTYGTIPNDTDESYDSIDVEVNADCEPEKNIEVNKSVIPVKISVSDVKRIHVAKDDDSDIEDFFAKKQGVVMKPVLREKDRKGKRVLTSAEKGTLVHTCLQLIDFEKCRLIYDRNAAEKYVEEFLLDMKNQNVFDEEEIKTIEKKLIVNFILSDIGKRIFNAERVYRETPFTIRMNWKEISGDKEFSGTDEYVSVQGIIDCFIVEDDGCVVIDYKTDYLKTDTATAVDAAYRIQIKCYSDAIEKITGKKVKESKLVYLRNL